MLDCYRCAASAQIIKMLKDPSLHRLSRGGIHVKTGMAYINLTRCTTAPDVHKIVSRHQHNALCATTAHCTMHSAPPLHTAQCTVRQQHQHSA